MSSLSEAFVVTDLDRVMDLGATVGHRFPATLRERESEQLTTAREAARAAIIVRTC